MSTQFQSHMVWNSKLLNVYFNWSALRITVKTTQKSDMLWSAIFSVIVYTDVSERICALICKSSIRTYLTVYVHSCASYQWNILQVAKYLETNTTRKQSKENNRQNYNIIKLSPQRSAIVYGSVQVRIQNQPIRNDLRIFRSSANT